MISNKNEEKIIMKAYKLFKLKKDGKLYPLYIETNRSIPVGEWIHANAGEPTEDGKVKSKLGKLAYRPGFHCCELPLADHIGKKMDNGKLCQADDTVWCEVLMEAFIDYTQIVKSNGKTPRDWCMKNIPENGFYRYRTNPNAKVAWFITSSICVTGILSDEMVKFRCFSAGMLAQMTEKEYNRIKEKEKTIKEEK